jgi:hypothetical protein
MAIVYIELTVRLWFVGRKNKQLVASIPECNWICTKMAACRKKICKVIFWSAGSLASRELCIIFLLRGLFASANNEMLPVPKASKLDPHGTF